MNKKGFMAIEVILSLSILSVIVPTICIIFSNTLLITNNSIKKIEMINIVKNEIIDYKSKIENYEPIPINQMISKSENKYEISTIIDKLEEGRIYYKINTSIQSENNKIEMSSYVCEK